jgi:hypothetical protein
MINRATYKRLKKMSPAAQFWEKRYILWRLGSYHQNQVKEDLELLEWSIKRHGDWDKEEEQ